VAIKVSKSLEILVAFKDTYNEYREKLSEYFPDGEVKEWEFAPVLVFHRYDKFIERVRLVDVSCNEIKNCFGVGLNGMDEGLEGWVYFYFTAAGGDILCRW